LVHGAVETRENPLTTEDTEEHREKTFTTKDTKVHEVGPCWRVNDPSVELCVLCGSKFVLCGSN